MRAFICLLIVCVGVFAFMYRDEVVGMVWCDYSCEVWKDINEIVEEINYQ